MAGSPTSWIRTCRLPRRPAHSRRSAPDGSAVLYTAGGRLHCRALNELDAYPIRGTDGAPLAPFFSHMGRRSATGTHRPVSSPDCDGGGTPVSLTRATALYDANWEGDGTIVYGQQDGIWRVSANGGERQQIVRIEANELLYEPRMLPDGRRVLVSLVKRDGMVGRADETRPQCRFNRQAVSEIGNNRKANEKIGQSKPFTHRLITHGARARGLTARTEAYPPNQIRG